MTGIWEWVQSNSNGLIAVTGILVPLGTLAVFIWKTRRSTKLLRLKVKLEKALKEKASAEHNARSVMALAGVAIFLFVLYLLLREAPANPSVASGGGAE